MPFIETRAGKIAVDVRGEGPPLVLLHAVGHDHRDYDDVRSALSKTHRTFAIDWPGHGESAMWRDPRAASVGALCDVLEDAVAALKVGPAVFMGNSVGGTASLRLATRAPDAVRGLVLVDSGGFSGTALVERTFCWVQGRELVRRHAGHAFARFYLKTRGAGRERVLERMALARQRPGFVEMDAAVWRSFGTGEVDFTRKPVDVRCPALIVQGRIDPVVRTNVDARRTREQLAHAAYVELDTGHVPFVENPEAFLDAVTPFLSSLGRGIG